VRYTARAKQVRAVVVTIRKVGGNHRVHQGKQVFKPGQTGTLRTGRLTATAAGYDVVYEVLTGPKGAKSVKHVVQFPVQVTP
jgi:hypothetical protein